MKKMVFVFITAVMLFSSCSSNSEPSAKRDFFNVDFGMSTIELFDIEGKPDKEHPNAKISMYNYFNRVFLGMPNSTMSYLVDKNGVLSGSVGFNNVYSDNKSYITEYENVKEKLISEWGDPIETIDNEDSFMHICSWGNKFLELYRKDDNSVIFSVSAYRQEYIDDNAWVTEAWTNQ